jgi:aspartate carbamoyltransferase catalytic subunit
MRNEHPMSGISWPDFQKLTPAAKVPYLAAKDGRTFHVLVAQQFNRQQLDAVGQLATQIRFIAKSEGGLKFLQELLSHKRAMLYFSQPSTRTFLSFCAACQILGVKVGEVRDTSTSSEFKGESQEDSVRTFSSYFDFIIMRTEIGGLAERMAWVLSNSDRPIPIINAGSGKDQHPTQALLDIYTLQRSFEDKGGIDGKTIVFVGDLLRGRTVRSLASLLTNYKNVKQCFVAPEGLQIGQDILDMLKQSGVKYELTNDFAKMIPVADAIYMTRIQDEWDTKKGGKKKLNTAPYCFGTGHLAVLKPTAIIMHPFPRRTEISPDVDHDPRAMYWRQMRNGMWIRAAIIASIFRRDAEIHDYYEESV